MVERFQFYLKHSLNDLSANKQRSLFGLFCIAAGVAAIVSLLTLGVMIENTLTGSLQESNRGDIRYSLFTDDEGGDDGNSRSRDSELTEDGLVSPEGLSRIIAWYADHLGASPEDNCADGAPFCITQRQGFNGNSGIFITSTAEDGEPITRPTDAFMVDSQLYPLYGEVRDEDDNLLIDLLDPDSYTNPSSETGDIVLSRNLADILKVDVGDVVRINGAAKNFTIRGIVATRTEGGLENILGSILGYYYLDLNAQTLFDDMEVGYSGVFVKLDDASQTQEVSDAFISRYPRFNGLANITTTEDLREQNEAVSEVVTQSVSVMGLVSMLIGGIGIVNTMLVMVRRRTGEVAVLKTLGLQPAEVSLLFLVEAVLMGIVGSVMGILLGFIMVFAIKGIAETFVAQSLNFTISPTPILTGLAVGTLVTTVFGFLPTLAASQVRPASVLRPQENVIPPTGRIRSFIALLIVVLALSAIAQGMLNDIFSGEDADSMRSIGGIATAVIGLLMGGSLLVSAIASWSQGNKALQVFIWGILTTGILPIAGYLLGRQLPAVLLIIGVFLVVLYLYVTLWLLIWAAGGGRFSELWPGALVLGFPLFWPLIPALIVLVTPIWILGRLIQYYTFIDFKIAMRSMLSAKGRGASTLVALVVGIFTLSLITMMVDTVRNAFDKVLVDLTGGNLIAFVPGDSDSALLIEQRLNEGIDGVNSFALIRQYNVQLVSFKDVSTGQVLTPIQLRQQIGVDLYDELRSGLDNGIDARSVSSNLPDQEFYRGRQLNTSDLGQSVIVVPANDATVAAGYDIGDEITLRFVSNEGTRRTTDVQSFTIVGMTDHLNNEIEGFSNDYYIPIDFLPQGETLDVTPTAVSVILDADDERISRVSTELLEIPGVFVLETRLINDLINRILDQFTRLPIIVAALALFTGGVVIANSVALSMMERRREIAIMKAVGLQRRRVLGMLLLENGLMGFIGGFIGVGISSAILFALLRFAFNSEFLGDTIPYATALMLMLLCIGIALVAAIVSVWGASSEKPLNVLRYE